MREEGRLSTWRLKFLPKDERGGERVNWLVESHTERDVGGEGWNGGCGRDCDVFGG